jgi:hypothetical protein
MLVTLIVLCVGFAFVNRKKTIETFMPPLSYKREWEVSQPYTAPSQMTSTLSPRMGNVSYGANINYKPPKENFLAVDPLNPLGVAADGEIQPIIYDRYIYAPKKSRLYRYGDPIRGDLAIAPLSGSWFIPSSTPTLDLREGAINVMSGQYNETSNSLSEMKYKLSGGTYNVAAGMKYTQPSSLEPVPSSTIPLYREMVNRSGDVVVSTLLP